MLVPNADFEGRFFVFADHVLSFSGPVDPEADH